MSRSVSSRSRSSSVAELVEKRARAPSGSAASRRSAAPAPRSTPTRSRRGAPRRAARRRCRSGLRSASAACRAGPRAPRRWPSRCTGSAGSAACRRAARRASRPSRSRSCGRRRSTSSQNVGQRRFGSTPSSSTRSRPPPATEPAENASAGQLIVADDAVDELDRRARRPGSRGTPRCRATRTARALDAARQPAHRVGRGVGGVVPARERGDQRRAPQRRFRVPADGHARNPSARVRTTGFRSVPSPSIVISTTSPSCSQRGGSARRRPRLACR